LAGNAPQRPALPTQRVVYWPSIARAGERLWVELNAWAARGWVPNLRQTMAYRALSSYALQRRHAIVLAPRGDDSDERCRQVNELLCALDGIAHGWTDPAAQCIRHPIRFWFDWLYKHLRGC
jgi:hypothetical protein